MLNCLSAIHIAMITCRICKASEACTHAEVLCAGGGLGPGKAAVGVAALMEQLVSMVPAKPRQAKGAFLFAVDHCFALKGQGTVLTGTVLSGATQVCPCHSVIAEVVPQRLCRFYGAHCCQGHIALHICFAAASARAFGLKEVRFKWLLPPCRLVIP